MESKFSQLECNDKSFFAHTKIKKKYSIIEIRKRNNVFGQIK